MNRATLLMLVWFSMLTQGCRSLNAVEQSDAVQNALTRIADLQDQGNLSRALEVSAETERRLGPDPLLICQRSAIYEKLNERSLAVAEAKRSIPLWAGGYLYTARLYVRFGDFEEALSILSGALADDRVRNDAKLTGEIYFQQAKAIV